jgi:2-keto-3-deoxy-L-rhamnonate aldolase RhmA
MVAVRMTRSNDVVMAIDAAGYDCFFADLEHGGLTLVEASQLCVTALGIGVTPFVRIATQEAYLASQVLNLGAMGIVAPHVDTPEQAKVMVDACMFAPMGSRGFSSNIPQLQYRKWPAAEVQAHINSQTTVMAQLETQKAVDNVEAIAAIPGLDIVEVGSNDLLQDLGIPGQHGHDKFLRALEKVATGARNQGKHCAVGGVPGTNLVKTFYDMGFRMILVGVDANLLAGALKDMHDTTLKLAK